MVVSCHRNDGRRHHSPPQVTVNLAFPNCSLQLLCDASCDDIFADSQPVMGSSDEVTVSFEQASKDLLANASDKGELLGQEDIQEWTLSPLQTALACSVLAVFCLVSQLANIGIVYYERVVPDTHRTLLNKLAALASLYQVVVATVYFPVVIVRLLGQGLGGSVCRLQGFFFMCSLTQLLMSYNELIILRYVYVHKLGTFGAIKEEITLRLLIWINLSLGVFLGSVHGMTVQLSGNLYQTFCTNIKLRTTDGKHVHSVCNIELN